MEETRIMRNILDTYQAASGQAINFGKSGIFFSGNVSADVRSAISLVLQVSTPLNTGKYLGLPSLIGMKKKAIFGYLKDRIWSYIQTWRCKLLSKAGREILIKAVAQSILSYCMRVFLLPVSLSDEIQRMINSFWWGNKKNGQRSISWLSWDRLSVRKENGGLGFRDFHGFNLAMLGKQGWSFMSSPDTLASRVFKAKYFPRGDFLNAQMGHNPSFVWRSIWSSQALLRSGCRWKIGDGGKVKVWQDPWLREGNNFWMESPVIEDLQGLMVHELMIPRRREWDVELINDWFNERDIRAILSIHLHEGPSRDTLIWHYSKNGKYSVKSGYWVASEILSSNVELRVAGDWCKLWKLQVPPKVKMFLWRASRNVLPDKINLQRRGIPVSLPCIFCHSDIENLWYLFVTCPFALSCWNEARLASIITSCSSNAESFVEWLFKMLNNLDTIDAGKFTMIMWNIWRQRNEKLWNNKHSSASHVVFQSLQILCEWTETRKHSQQNTFADSLRSSQCKAWYKPPVTFLKCNTDAAVFLDSNAVGLSCVLRDESGLFVACRVQLIEGIPDVKECEALSLLKALTRVRLLGFGNVIFELDAKGVVDAVNSPNDDASEFGSIVQQCISHVSQQNAFSICFVNRQANMTAHVLARAARFYASPSFFFEVPQCLIAHLENICNLYHC